MIEFRTFPAPVFQLAVMTADARERAEAAAKMLWGVQPTDRALTGWMGWNVPGAPGEAS